MALSKERMGEIAMIALQELKEREGVLLKPKEIRREIMNESKKLNGVSPQEVAEFARLVIKATYEKVDAELAALAGDNSIIIS